MNTQEDKREEDFSLQGWRLEEIESLIQALQGHQVELEIENKELRALTRRLVEGQELERQQLARELHDEFGQNLTALGFNLNFMGTQLAQPSPKIPLLQECLRGSFELVEQTAERIREVMADLRPPMLDDYGLVEALEWYGQRFAKGRGLKVMVEGDHKLSRLEVGIEMALFRITQEALNNAANHAQATEVTLAVFEVGEKIRLVIGDDGVGFEPGGEPPSTSSLRQALRQAQEEPQDAASTGSGGTSEGASGRGFDKPPPFDRLRRRASLPAKVGLVAMRERAEAVGGSCWIEAEAGGGTRVIVEVSP